MIILSGDTSRKKGTREELESFVEVSTTERERGSLRNEFTWNQVDEWILRFLY